MDLMGTMDCEVVEPSAKPVLATSIYLVAKCKTYHLSFFIHH